MIDEKPHPCTQRLDGRIGVSEPRRCFGKLLGFVAIDGFDKRVAGRKMAIERTAPDPGGTSISFRLALDPFSAKTALAVVNRCARFRSASARGLRARSTLSSATTRKKTLVKRGCSPNMNRRHSPLMPNAGALQGWERMGRCLGLNQGVAYDENFQRDIHYR